MNRLEFRYIIDIRMDAPIQAHHFTLRCLPCEDAGQSVESLNLHITPNDYLAYGKDQWSNPLVYGACRGLHTQFRAEVSGIVKTGLVIAVPQPEAEQVLPFRYATALTKADEQIKAFAEEIAAKECDTYEYTVCLTHALHEKMRYCPGSTQTSTTAAEAFAKGEGVCQDYAHIMLSALRLRGIPARYVVGIIPGEGASHAWVEVWLYGAWYAFDPTNDTYGMNQYIAFSHGRDHRDCEINRGVFRGFCVQQTEIFASVSDAGGKND